MVVVILAGSLLVASMLGLLTAWSGAADDYREITVQYGDTLWEIAAESYPDEDIRMRVFDICKTNHIRADQLRPGQRLLLPVD
jgi:LysM repeat protein